MRTLLPFLCTVLAGYPALAQDTDGDGVADAADAFPCDPELAGLIFAPGEGAWTVLAFEDQWPSVTDLDFNDVVLRAHYRLYADAQGRVRRLRAFFEPVALGGIYDNGLALQLPVARAGVTARLRAGSGPFEALALEADAQATVILSPNLRALFGGAPGLINSQPGGAHITGTPLELEVELASPATMNTGLAPFDLFIFRSGDFGHQIHFPAYAGTAAMRAALFGTDNDDSRPGRYFVHRNGTPFALNLQSTTRYPLEGVSIDRLFPDIVAFAASGGATHSDFFLTNVVTAEGRAAPDTTPPAEPEPDRACVPRDAPGSLLAWGLHQHGSLGLGGPIPPHTQTHETPQPVFTPESRWRSVAAGYQHALAVREDGTLWSWGWNGAGQLGHQIGAPDRNEPTQVGTDTWVQVAAAGANALAIRSDGTLWGWGQNYYGELGLGHAVHRGTPQQVGTASDWVQVAVGGGYSSSIRDGFTLGIRADGSLWGFGLNSSGQLGLGDFSWPLIPVRVGHANDWVQVAAGFSHALGIRADGSLWAWGTNGEGQLGLGDHSRREAPTRVGTANDWVQVAAGWDATRAIRADGSLWAWGRNYYGELGIGVTGGRSTPTRVGSDNDWAYVALGVSTDALAVRTDGSLWGFGQNYFGALGVGDRLLRLTPTRVTTRSDWSLVAVGSVFSVGVAGQGSLPPLPTAPPPPPPPSVGPTGGLGTSSADPGESCLQILADGGSTGDGVYWLAPGGAEPFQVWCDMTRHGGGWALVGSIGESATAGTAFDAPRSVEALLIDVPSAGTYAHLDLGRFDSWGTSWTIRSATDAFNDQSHFQYTFYRPRPGADATPSRAGRNWNGTDTHGRLEHLNRTTTSGAQNTTWLQVPACGGGHCGCAVNLFTYRTGGGDCLDASGQTAICHAISGGVSCQGGTMTAAFGVGDGVSHSWGRKGTYWIRPGIDP